MRHSQFEGTQGEKSDFIPSQHAEPLQLLVWTIKPYLYQLNPVYIKYVRCFFYGINQENWF